MCSRTTRSSFWLHFSSVRRVWDASTGHEQREHTPRAQKVTIVELEPPSCLEDLVRAACLSVGAIRDVGRAHALMMTYWHDAASQSVAKINWMCGEDGLDPSSCFSADGVVRAVSCCACLEARSRACSVAGCVLPDDGATGSA